jgi:hypothetical protein
MEVSAAQRADVPDKGPPGPSSPMAPVAGES